MSDRSNSNTSFRYFGNENVNNNIILTPENKGSLRLYHQNNNSVIDDSITRTKSKSQRFVTPGSFRLFDEEALVQQGVTSGQIDPRDSNESIMLKRDLNRSALFHYSKHHSASPVETLWRQSPYENYMQGKSKILIDRVETEKSGGNSTVSSGFLRDQDLVDYPSYPLTPMQGQVSRDAVGKMGSLVFDSNSKEESRSVAISDTTQEESTDTVQEKTSRLCYGPVVKVNYPQYAMKLLPNDAPLDLRGLEKSNTPQVHFLSLQQTESEEKAVIDILNYEISNIGKSLNHSKSNRISNFFYRLFNCGETSTSEIEEKYPWVQFLRKIEKEDLFVDQYSPPATRSTVKNVDMIPLYSSTNVESIEMQEYRSN